MIGLNFKRLSAVFVSVVIGMFSVGTSAQTPDVDVTFTSTTAANFFKTYGDVTVATSSALSAGSNSDGYCIKLDKTVDGVINQGYFEVVSAGAAISKIELDVTANSSNASIQPTMLGWKSSAAVSSATNTADYVTSVSYQGGSTYNVGSAASTVTFDLSGQDLKAVRVFRMVKNMYIGGSSSATSVGVGQTVRVWGFRVYLAASGPKAPVLSISDNATQSVSQGNAISNIVVTSDKAATFNLAGSLPTGVSGTATDSKTYTISGSSNVIGNYTYSVTATADDLTSDAVGGTISVVEGPALNITNGTQEVMAGNAITNIVVTSDNPSTTFSVTGLPAGVTGSGSGSTYTISGTPTAEGTFNFVVSGTAGGNTKTVNGTITVVERQETSTNYTILTTKSATPTVANGGIPAALEGTVVSSIKSTWDGTNGYKIGANADTLIVDISALPQSTYIKSASFTVKMGSTYTIGYIYDKEDKQTYNFGSSGAVATATPANEYGRVLKIFRTAGTGTTIGDITLTIATGVVMPPVLTASNNVNQTISAGKAIQDIVITSDKPATFDGTLPAGLTGTTSNGGLTYTISGTPSSSTNVEFAVTATAEGKTSQAVSGTISIIQGPVLNITNASQTTTNGTAIKTIQITSNDGETTYSVSGLPSGVTGSGSGTSFAISGTPTAVGTFQYVVTGTLGGYSKTVNGTIIVQPAAPKLTASSNIEQEVQLNHAISTITITSDTAVAFSISCLPAGVVAIAGADSTRLIITGKATMLETTSFSVVAKAHGKGKQSNSISGQITVTEDAVAAAPVLTPSASSISVDKGVAITDLVITSDVAATWAIDKALPAGLTGTASADGLTYTISGAPTAVSASSVYTISATANELTTEQPVTITVNAVAPVVTAPSNATQNVALGEAIGNISFSSSDADAVFSVEGLPAGLTAVQNGSTYTISGTATAAGEFTYTVTATVDGLSDSKTGTITVNEPVTYSVTFKDYDGTVLKQQTGILAGGFATAPTAPTRTGYTFAGWDKSYSNVTDDLIVTATYTINTYTVKFFDKDNNQIGATQTVNYGGNATAPTAPAVTGYTFAGWDKSYSNVTEDLVVTATYTINTYTVKFFDKDNNQIGTTQTVNYGGDATAPTAPAVTGYTFSGWDKSYSNVTEDLVVTATYTINTYTVKFFDKDNNQIGATQTVNYGGNATAPTAPAVTGYTFSGWDKSYSNVTEDLVVTATYTINTYTVKFFDKDNNQIGTTQTVNYGGNATAPTAPAVTGYTFSGWDKSYSNVTEDLIVTATYTINTYTVKFFDKDNNQIGATQTVNYGGNATAPTAPAVTGYTFAGWDKSYSNVTEDLIVTATYTINTYTVTFKDWNGDVLKSQNVAYGNSATAPATPTRTGYTFSGWDKPYSNVTEDLIVTATYTINTYTVKFFDKDNNQIGTTQTVNYGGNATAPTAPAVTGYTFVGWDKSYSNVTEDLVVTATYTINTYTVTFKNWNGDVLKTQSVAYGSAATEPTVPARTGYTFTGWDADFGNVTGDIIATATFSTNAYSVTFKDWNGDVLKSQNVAYGNSATAPATPTRTGYTFSGWDKSYSNVTEDLIVTATYTINTYTVTFKNWNGDVLKTQSVAYGSAATEPTVPARAGYTFTGWDADFSNVTGDVVATATFSTNAYSVTFKDWNGDVLKSQNVAYGNSATAPATPTRTGYTFAGWDKSYSNVTEDLVVTATYTINTYTVKFFDKDNNQIGATQTVNYGGNATAPTAPVVTGYAFAGWDADFSNVTEDLIVTATYTINTYTVTFKNWNGDVLSTQTVDYGAGATEPTVPAREGYTFTGWDADFGYVTGDVVATATFSTNAYSVTFKDWNGDVLKSQNVAYGNSATAPATPTRTGYTFAGWDKSYSNVTEDLIVTATYTINTYTVKFFDKDNNQIGATQTVNYGGNATAPAAPAVTGYTFAGWDKSYSNVTEDLIVTATYTINTYTVTFKNWNGDVLKTQSAAYGSAATEPTVPARAGYTFAGWDKSYSNVTEDLVVTATYAINTYTVKFFDNDNNQIGATQTVNYGGNATAPTAPAVTGYTFAGWDKPYSNVTEDLVVTATYTINTYTVTFKNWNGDVLSTQTVDYGAGATEPTVPAREGYEFIGWDKTFNNVMSDMIIIAQYEELSTPVTPSITVPDNATQTVALNENIEDIIFEVDNTNADISVTGLPDGVTYEQLGNTVVISGKPTESGTFTYVVKAEADGLASTKESVIIVEEQPENPTSVDETALNYSWKQTQNSVALEGVNVKIMTLYSESGARIKTVRGSNEINTSELVYGSRFIVVAVVEGKSNPIANKFIK